MNANETYNNATRINNRSKNFKIHIVQQNQNRDYLYLFFLIHSWGAGWRFRKKSQCF